MKVVHNKYVNWIKITVLSVEVSTVHPTSAGLTTKNKKMTKPTKPMYKPGIMKDKDQSVSTYSADIKFPENKI